jgi:hypothetical protein
MANRNTADVLSTLRTQFPSGRVTRQELKAHCKANKVPYPRFITKDKARRVAGHRGVYSLALRPAASRPAPKKTAPAVGTPVTVVP